MIAYNGNLATPTINITTVKCHLNSTISDANAKYATMDIKNFYLGTPMAEYEYICVPLSTFPEEIRHQYNLAALATNNYVMVEVQRGMYGLPQAGILANTQLRTLLSKHGYD